MSSRNFYHKTVTLMDADANVNSGGSVIAPPVLLYRQAKKHQGPVVQRLVSLKSSLRVISLTVLADSIYNILIFFAEKM